MLNLVRQPAQKNRDKLALMKQGDLGSLYPKRAVKKDENEHMHE